MLKMNLRGLAQAREQGRPVTWLTCYDFSMASALNKTDLDMILVGDSGGMVVLGYSDTVPVTMDEMLTLTAAVRRGAPDKFLVGDMPKGSYEITPTDAAKNAMRFVKGTGCDAVKLEGGETMCDAVAAISRGGVPVFGHIGLTPQSSGSFGGYRVVGRDSSEVERLIADAHALEQAGAVAILLEALPPSVGRQVTEAVSIPTLGIGAGPNVDGQLMILHDLLGLYPTFRPKFAKCYVPDVVNEFVEGLATLPSDGDSRQRARSDGLGELIRLCVQRFVEDVSNGTYPGEEHCYAEG